MGDAARKLEWSVDELIGLFKTFPILLGFPQNLMAQLAEASEILNINTGNRVLTQGQINHHLYFLIEGQIGVYVDGGRVSQLAKKGDMLGEMSVISSRPVSATLTAETDVRLIRFDSRIFLKMEGPKRDLYLSVLYRIYATVLSEKLAITNQKAKHFEDLTVQLKGIQSELEEANEDLESKIEERTLKLEQQNAELLTSRNKLSELINSKKVLVQKLSDFHDKHLDPLKEHLDILRTNYPGQTVVDDARRVVFEVQQLLGPLTDQYSSEQAMLSKRVLLADTNKKQQVLGKLALGGTGVEIETASTLDEAKAKLDAKTFDLVFLDSGMIELGNVIAAKNPQPGMVLMTSQDVPTYLNQLKALPVLPNIVSRDDADRTFTVKNIVTTATKLLSRDYFGLEKYMSWGTEIQSTQVPGSRHRAKIIGEVDAYFEKLGIRRANRDRIHTVMEELLMNAIYDAPALPNGTPLFNHLARTNEVTLTPEQQGLVRFATDGMLVAVSVQDPFGSLKPSVLLRYLESNYGGAGGEKLNAQENKGGAGRGLHQIVENSDLVIFNVDPGKRTEVIALFNVDVKDTGAKNPSFHLFVK